MLIFMKMMFIYETDFCEKYNELYDKRIHDKFEKNFEIAFDVNQGECPEAAQIIVTELPAFPKQEQGKEKQANPTQIHVHGLVRLWDFL